MAAAISSKFVVTEADAAIPIAVSPSGNIYIQGNSNPNTIYIYNASGTLVSSFAAPDTYFGFCIDYVNNRMYCAGVGSFARVDLSTNTLTSFSSAWINCLDVALDGTVYATTNSGYKIQKIVPSTGAQTNIFTGTGNIQTDSYGVFGGLAIDNNGFIYCTTRGTGYVYKFNTSGTLLGLYATIGTADYAPTFGLTCDRSTNNLYLSSAGNTGAVFKITPTGSVSTLFLTARSYGVFYDKIRSRLVSVDTNLYASTRTTIYFTPLIPGPISSQFFTTGTSDIGTVIVTTNGNVYVTAGSKLLYVFSNSGKYITTISPSDWIAQAAIDYNNDTIYCVGPNSVFSINMTTNAIGPQFPSSYLAGCALSSDGFLYATTHNGYLIQKINLTTGVQTNIFAASNGNITSESNGSFGQCTFDSNEFLYCITRGIGSIYKFTKDGTLLGLIATTGGAYGDTYGLTCDITTNILYATSTGSTGAVYKITGGNSELYTTIGGPSYGAFYDKISKKVYVSSRPQTVNICNPFIPLSSSSYAVNSSKAFYYYPFVSNYLNYASSGSGVSDASATGVSISAGALLLPGTSTQSVKLPTIQFGAFGLTVAFWLKCVTIPTNWARIFDFATSTATYANNFFLGFSSTGVMELKFNAAYLGTTSTVYKFPYKLTDTNWHHYAISITNTGNILFYVDGAQIAGFSYTVYPTLSSFVNNFIGKSPISTDGYLNAYLNHFFVFNRVITANEIIRLSNNQTTLTLTPAVTSDSYSLSPTNLVYGTSANITYNYSNPYLVPRTQYALYNGASLVATKTYTGITKIVDTLYSSAVDESGNLWAYTGAASLLIVPINIPGGTNTSFTLPSNPGSVWARVRYYNGYIYFAACSGYAGTLGLFTVVNPYTRTIVYSDASNIYSDFDFGNDGFMYAVSATWRTNPRGDAWRVDKINLQTYAKTTVINGTANTFGNNSTDSALTSIAFDADDNMYIGSQTLYVSKWSKSGVRLMAPIRIIDPLYNGVVGSLFDCHKASNTLFIWFFDHLIAANMTTLETYNVVNVPTDYSQIHPSVDNVNNILYFRGYRIDLTSIIVKPTPTIQFNGVLNNISTVSFQVRDNSGNVLSSSELLASSAIQVDYPCFLQGSKILILNLETDEDEYIAVERLKKGDLVRTATCGYKAVAYIGRGTLYRPVDDPNPKNRLYKFQEKTRRHPPLFITGEHCLLYKEKDISPEKRREVCDFMGDDYITEVYHRVPACLDDSGTPYSGKKGPVTIWHFALEHNNLYNNYAVWANGILVETCSIDFLVNLTSMELI
jgi:hypothetical protein